MADLVVEVKIKNSTKDGAEEAKRSVKSIGDEAKNTSGVYRDSMGRMRDETGRFVRSTDQAAKSVKSLANVDFSRVKENLNNLGNRIKNIGDSISGLGQKMTLVLTTPIVGLSVLIGQLGVGYESSLNIFQAVTKATADEMRQASKVAKDLGADIDLPATSAKDAALAMAELGKAGLTATQAMESARAVLMLAAAGQLDEAKAAEITANALNAFSLEAKEASRVADLLAASANASSAEVTDVAESFQQASATFAAAKIPIEDLTTAIAIMANAGIKGSDAGTSLKTFLSSIQAPSTKGAETLQKLGISVFDLEGKMKSLPDVIGQFEKSLAGLTDQEKVEAIQNIFGADASRAAQILFRDGVAGFEKIKQAVTEVGAASDLAKAKTKGLGGAWEALKSQAETVGITIFEALKGPAEQAVRFLADSLEKVSDFLAKLAESNPAIIQLGAVILGVIAAAGPLLVIFGTLIGFIGTIVSGIGTLIGVLAPLGTFIVSFIGLIGQAGLVASFSALASVLTGTVTAAISPVLAGLASLLPVIAAVAAVIGVLIGASVALYAAYETNFGGVRDLINDAMATIQQTIQNGLQFILNFWATYGTQIVTTATNVFRSIANFVEPAVTELVSFVREYYAQLVEVAGPILAQLSILFQREFEKIKLLVQAALYGINNFWQTHGEQIKAVVSATWTILKTVVMTAMRQIANVITLILAVINGDWSQAWASFKSILQTAVNSSVTVISALAKIIFQILKSIVLGIINAGKEFYNAAVAVGKNLGEGLINGLTSLKDRIVSVARSIISTPLNIFRSEAQIQSPSKVTTEIGEYLSEGLAVGMGNRINRVRASAKRVADEAIKNLREALKEFKKLAGASPETVATIRQTDRVNQAISDLQEIIKLRAQLGINQSLPLPATVADVESEVSMLRQRALEAEKYSKTLDELRETYNDLQDAAARANEEFAKKIEQIQQNGELELLNLREEIALTGVVDEMERRRIQNSFDILRLRAQMANDGYGEQQINEAAEALRVEQARRLELEKILSIRKQVAEADSLEKDLTERLSQLQNGNRELTEYEKTLQKINTVLKDISPQQKENLLILAQQIDAQREYNEAYQKTYDYIHGVFDILLDSSTSIKDKLKDIFGNIVNSFKKMLADMATAWLTSKLLSIFGLGGSFNHHLAGGLGPASGIGVIGGGIFNWGLSGGSSGLGSSAGGSQGNIIQELAHALGHNRTEGAGPASSVLSGAKAGGIFGNLKNFFSAAPGGIFAPPTNPFTGKQQSGLAGYLSGIGAIASMVGGFLPGKLGNVVSMVGTGMQIGSMFGPWGAAIGAAIGFFSGLFGSKKRKIDKNENLPKLQEGFKEAFDQLRQLASDRNAFYSDPEGTLEKARSIRQQIKSGFGIKFQSDKYRKIAQQQIAQKLNEADRIIREMETMRDQAITARTIDEQLNAAFAGGVYMDASFLRQYAKFKRRNGMLPGVFTGRDVLPSYLAEGEMVLNPFQISKVIQNAGGVDVFKGAGIPNYSTGTFVAGNPQPAPAAAAAPASSGERTPIVVKIYQNNSGLVESDITGVIIEGLQNDYEVQTELVKSYDKTKARGE